MDLRSGATVRAIPLSGVHESAPNRPRTLFWIRFYKIMVVEILVPLAFFAAIVLIVKVVSDNRVRRKLIDARVSADVTEAVLSGRFVDFTRLGALKWGLIVLGLGGALVLIELFPITMSDPMAFGLLFLAAGGGLIAYYLMADRLEVSEENDPSDWSRQQSEHASAEEVSDELN